MKGPFEKIKLAQLHSLCSILAESKVRHLNYIKQRYSENHYGFEETLTFLVDLKIVKNDKDIILNSRTFPFVNESLDAFKRKFLPVLFSGRGEVSQQLKIFLLNFQTDYNQISFTASTLEKIKFGGTRNLLLELEFITSSTDGRTYTINPEFEFLFVKQFTRKKLAPEVLKRKQAENDALGLNAEQEIIEFEKKRLTDISFDSSEIEHTAKINILAGYDIKSFENHYAANSKRIDRYIEVKAVSIQDYLFYWSKNEIEIAKVFGERYYLYLLPAIAKNVFVLEKLLIIRNPYKNIYSNKSEWIRQEESISFTKIIEVTNENE